MNGRLLKKWHHRRECFLVQLIPRSCECQHAFANNQHLRISFETIWNLGVALSTPLCSFGQTNVHNPASWNKYAVIIKMITFIPQACRVFTVLPQILVYCNFCNQNLIIFGAHIIINHRWFSFWHFCCGLFCLFSRFFPHLHFAWTII